ncbi:MAG: SAM-dependent methyltransferase, partial [Pseudomonadota bacterium]|nr:SAM-dependent methyltransferase [Pseudomonadota bacterium]
MLDLAQQRCPEASFSQQDMCAFSATQSLDLITCFLYSIHYSGSIERLRACIASVHAALADGGVFCFNAVDKSQIDNSSFVSHSVRQQDATFWFSSGWFYAGEGEQQRLRLRIERADPQGTQLWKDEHPMVAVTFGELLELLEPYFEVQLLEHDYQRLVPWDGASGNALVVGVRRDLI